MNNDDFLISQLISETYDEAPSKEQPNDVFDLRSYFEKKLNEVEFISIKQYLTQNNLKTESVTYQEKTQCFRVVLNTHTLDFPSNWSIFNDLKNTDLVYLEAKEDKDFLIDIFNEINGTQSNLAMVKHDSEISMVFVPEENSKEHLKWFRGFFEKKGSKSKESGEAA